MEKIVRYLLAEDLIQEKESSESIPDCNRTTEANLHPGDQGYWYQVPWGNCNSIIDRRKISVLACRDHAADRGYSCFQVTQTTFGVADAWKTCYGCIK